MNRRLAIVAVSFAVLAACHRKPKNPNAPVEPPASKVVDAGVDPATAAARAAEAARRGELVQKCRSAVWGPNRVPGIAVANCDLAYKEDPRASVKALLSQAKQMMVALDAAEKHDGESRQADAALAKGDGETAYKLLRSCCGHDKARLAKAAALAEKQCTRQLKSPQHDVAPCYQWFDSVCEKLPQSDWHLPEGKKLKLTGALGKNDWRPRDPRIAFLVSTQSTATGKAALTCQPPPQLKEVQGAEHDPKSWFDSWYDYTDARDALNAYYQSGTGPKTETVINDPFLSQSFAKLASLEREAANAIDHHKAVDGLKQLDEALALDTRVVVGTDDAGVPVPPVLFEGGHRTRLLELYARGALVAGQDASAKGDTAEACRLFELGLAKQPTAELKKAAAACPAR